MGLFLLKILLIYTYISSFEIYYVFQLTLSIQRWRNYGTIKKEFKNA